MLPLARLHQSALVRGLRTSRGAFVQHAAQTSRAVASSSSTSPASSKVQMQPEGEPMEAIDMQTGQSIDTSKMTEKELADYEKDAAEIAAARAKLKDGKIYKKKLDPSDKFASQSQHRHEYHVQDGEEGENLPVLTQRLPEDFVKHTLTPHLEEQILHNIHVYSARELANCAKAYSKLRIRQQALSNKLSEQIKYRMIEFDALSLVDTVNAMWTLTPNDKEVFEMLGERAFDIIEDFNALNLIGLVRIYNKVKHYQYLAKLIPRLREMLTDYETDELSEMLVALAQSGAAIQDQDVLICLVPEIMRRFHEVPLQVQIVNLWAMTKLKIVHPDMIESVARGLADPFKSKNMPPRYVSRVTWVFKRCGEWDRVKEYVLPMFQNLKYEFDAVDFAKLSQALFDDQHRGDLKDICENLRPKIALFSRKEFSFFMLGAVRCSFLEKIEDDTTLSMDSILDSDKYESTMLREMVKFIQIEQDHFQREEIERIVTLLYFLGMLKKIKERR